MKEYSSKVIGKEIDVILPGNVKDHIVARKVLSTVDGKYILNYSYKDSATGLLKDDYMEIIFVDGKWAKYPFKKEYEEYKFNTFDEEKSNSIIRELPTEMRIKISIRKESERNPRVVSELMRDMLCQTTGSRVIKNGNKERSYYMVLFANDENHSILVNDGSIRYNLDFNFPTFSLPYNSIHKVDDYSPDDDENYGIEYKQMIFPHDDIPANIRKLVFEFLEKQGVKFDVTKLPILELIDEESGEKIKICFVSCPDVDMFNYICNSDILSVGSSSYNCSYDNVLDSAFHNERPLIIENSRGIITNGVKHIDKQKK